MKPRKDKKFVYGIASVIILIVILLFSFYRFGVNRFLADVTPTATIAATPSSGSFAVGQEFSVDLVVNGGGQYFTSFGADVSVSNLTVVSLTKGPVDIWKVDPTASALSFLGGIQGTTGTNNITVYTLKVKGNNSGPAGISITNGSVIKTDGISVSQIFSSAVNGSYTITFSVNAGADKTTNTSFTQAGSSVGGSTYQWSKTSGPGTVTFGSPASASTTISASADGTYTIRLTATSASGQTAYDEMSLIWDTTPPTVNAGENKTTNKSITQTSTVSGAATYQWSKTSGPGTVTFGSPTAKDTTISASADGTYVIRLTAADAIGNSSSDEMSLVWDTTPPTANAGVDKSTYINKSFALTGTATGAVSYLWSRTSGAGTVTFNPADGLVTNVTIGAAGVCQLSLKTTDAAGNTATDSVSITVHKNGDIDNDSIIDSSDFTLLLWNWGVPINPMADYDGNGVVEMADFTILLYWWGK